MSCQNPILTDVNAQLEVTNLTQNTNPSTSTPDPISSVPWIPLTTADGSGTGQIVVPVVLAGGSLTPTNPLNPGMPGNADYVAYTYTGGGATNNIATATYKTGGSGGTTIAVYTYTYVSGGVADNDRVATLTIT